MDIFALAGLIAIIIIPIMLIMRSNQQRQLGTIRRKRCSYQGPAKGQWVPFRGAKPVCAKCQSEDWVTIQDR